MPPGFGKNEKQTKTSKNTMHRLRAETSKAGNFCSCLVTFILSHTHKIHTQNKFTCTHAHSACTQCLLAWGHRTWGSSFCSVVTVMLGKRVGRRESTQDQRIHQALTRLYLFYFLVLGPHTGVLSSLLAVLCSGPLPAQRSGLPPGSAIHIPEGWVHG